jgi:hypothetical protein
MLSGPKVLALWMQALPQETTRGFVSGASRQQTVNAAGDQKRMRDPAGAGGVIGCIRVVTDDVDAHCARAAAPGTEIVTILHDYSRSQGHSFSTRD